MTAVSGCELVELVWGKGKWYDWMFLSINVLEECSNVAIFEEFTWASRVSSSILRCFDGLVKNASRVLLFDILSNVGELMTWAGKTDLEDGNGRMSMEFEDSLSLGESRR